MLDEDKSNQKRNSPAVQNKPSPAGHGLLARMKRHSAAGVSALAIAAVLATASLAPLPARAVTEPPAASQPLPSFAPLVERVKPAVVSIRVKAEQDEKFSGGNSPANPFEGTPFERFFNDPNSPFAPFNQPGGPNSGKRIIMGQGSGFFISPDGYLVTNNHVVDSAVNVEVSTTDGKTYKAKVIGTDPRTDIALLKVDAEQPFAFVKLSASGAKVGDWVVAMGNPFGLGGTVTAGIVSARGRDIGEGPYDDFLQIDAPVNKGNSGGPTFNQAGEVVGVNTAIYSPSGGSVGIAFDVPASVVERVTAQLKEHGRVTRGWLGVQVQPVTREIADSLGLREARGALVSGVQDGGPAAKAGVKSGDVIEQVNGEAVKDSRGLARMVADIAPDSSVTLAIRRNGSAESLKLTLGELKEKQTAKLSGENSSHTAAGALGLRVAPASEVTGPGDKGLAVTGVAPGGKADEAGLTAGDVILKVAGSEVDKPADLTRALADAKAQGKDHALALVERKGGQLFVALPVQTG
jgi:serine protease Do